MKRVLHNTWQLTRQHKTFTGVLIAAVLLELLVYPRFIGHNFEVDIDVLRLGLLVWLFYLAAFPKQNHYQAQSVLVTGLIPLIALGVIAAYVISPVEADRLGQEDNIVENLSAIALFMASGAMFIVGLALLIKKHWQIAVVALLVAGLFCLIGLEEISWGQRVLEVESSEFFLENNWQEETNLHNLHTYASEYAYYFGAFLLLVLMPFFRKQFERLLSWMKLPKLAVFIPSLWFVVPFAAMAGFIKGSSYSHALPILIILAGSLVLVAHRLVEHAKAKQLYFVLMATLSLLAITLSFVFFYKFDYVSYSIREWSATEYKELIIAIGLLVYVADTVLKPNGLMSLITGKKRRSR